MLHGVWTENAHTAASRPRHVATLLENVLGAYVIGNELKLTFALALIIGVLLVRPTGLLGSRTVTRV